MAAAHRTFYCSSICVTACLTFNTLHYVLQAKKTQLQGSSQGSCQESIFVVPKHFFQILQQTRKPQSKTSSQIGNSSVLVDHGLYSK